MNNNELPQIYNMSYAGSSAQHCFYEPINIESAPWPVTTNATSIIYDFKSNAVQEEFKKLKTTNDLFEKTKPTRERSQAVEPQQNKRRIIQTFIADPDDKVALDHALIYEGKSKLTDLTDQELFFEIPIMELLKTHNEYRAKTIDKKATEKAGKEIFLEPARIRDLAMTVITIASF